MHDRKITTLVIDRAKWGTKFLLSSVDDDRMCCLGFLAIKCGADQTEIEDEGSPYETPNINWPAAFIRIGHDFNHKKIIKDSNLCKRMMAINDSEDPNKERKLIILFKQAGIKLSFKGKFEP